MSWTAFAVGVVFGTAVGVLVVALCQMATGARSYRITNGETQIGRELQEEHGGQTRLLCELRTQEYQGSCPQMAPGRTLPARFW